MHTKGANDSAGSFRNIPIVDDLTILDISDNESGEVNKAISLEERSVAEPTKDCSEEIEVFMEVDQIDKTTFKCVQCDYNSLNHNDLLVHISSKHKDTVQEPSEKEGNAELIMKTTTSGLDSIEELTCRNCVFEAEDALQLREHMQKQHGTEDIERLLQCSNCEFVNNEVEQIQEHVQNMHNTPRFISCNQCDFKCKLNMQLQKHTKTKHNYPCGSCELVFSEEIKLNMHKQTMHKNLKVNIEAKLIIVSCEKFDYKCKLNKQLQKHIRMKHKELEFRCGSCELVFSEVENLNVHEQTMHKTMRVDMETLCKTQANA